MSFGLTYFLLLVTASSLLALPLRTRREDNFEVSIERSSRDATEISMNENSDLFEGDIKLSGPNPYENVVKRDAGGSGDGDSAVSTEEEKDSIAPNEESINEAYKSRDDLWEGGKVFYKFDTILDTYERKLSTDAMEWWSDATRHNGVSCITFAEAKNNEKDYLLFRKVDENEGCSSYVGRQGGEQFVNMSDLCLSVGSIAHELGHALGLWHEQSRPDRDMYIKVLYENIVSQEIADKNFGILSESTFSKVPPVPYDIGSIMHYGTHAFTKDQNKPTIQAIKNVSWGKCENDSNIGQRDRISYKDALRIKLLYGCGDVTPTDMPGSCKQPTPTPTLAPTPSPNPYPKPNPIPTPTLTKKIQTNNVITLHFHNKPKFGVRCAPNVACTPIPCTEFAGGLGLCSTTNNDFRIIRPGDTRIGDGDKVLLRSAHKNNLWLNCSGINKECIMSECTSNAADSNFSSYISDCEDHFFIIKGVNRSPGQVLSIKHKIQFKSYKDDTYMNCVERKCRMIGAGVCPNENLVRYEQLFELANKDKDTGKCDIQHFNITKTSEI